MGDREAVTRRKKETPHNPSVGFGYLLLFLLVFSFINPGKTIAGVSSCQDLPARITGPTPHYYSTLRDAYAAAVNGDVIQSLAVTFTENLTFNQGISVAIQGGYDCGYATQSGNSALEGIATDSTGTVTIGNYAIVSASPDGTHVIASSAGAYGTISPAGTMSIANGGSQTYLIIPANGYQVTQLLIDGTPANLVTSYTFTNVSMSHSISAVFADITPPAGSIVINNGAAATNTVNVNLTLSASDVNGVTQMLLSNDTTTWVAADYATTMSWTLLVSDGSKTVYAKFKDGVGNWSTIPAFSTILLDTMPPTTSATPTGGLYNSAQNVTLASSETATIYYSTNGTPPTTSSPVYSSPISLATNATTTVQYFAKDPAGNSETAKTSVYTIDTIPPTTSATPAGGYYNGPVSVMLVSSETATIYYTTDGTTPTTSSPVYGSPINITATTAIKYFAKDRAGNSETPIKSDTYTIDTTPPITSATPAGGIYKTPQNVTLASSEAGTIYYTTDGTPPTISSPVYGGPINIATTTTIKYFAKDPAENSETPIKSDTYAIDTIVPVLTLSMLDDGSNTNNAMLDVSGTVTDNVGVLAVTVNGALATVNPDGTFSQMVTLATGSNTILIVATDLARNETAVLRNIIYGTITIPPILVGDIGYVYDDAGRLTVAATSDHVVRWQYDEVGNLISIVTATANPAPPVIQSISPDTLLADYQTFVTIAGNNLTTTKTVFASIANSNVAVLSVSDTQIQALITLPPKTASGYVVFTVTTLYGSAAIQATIASSTLSFSPDALGIWAGSKGSVTATISPALGKDVTVPIKNDDPAAVSAPKSVLIPAAGTTTFEVNALAPGSAAISSGHAAVHITVFADVRSQPVSVYIVSPNAGMVTSQPVSVYLPPQEAGMFTSQPVSVYLPPQEDGSVASLPVSVEFVQ